MRSKLRLPGSGWALSAAVGCAALAAGLPAQAGNAAHPAAGVLRMPNVRVEMATPSQVQQAARIDASAPGMRAFIDPETNELRDPRPEEMLAPPEAMSRSRAKAAVAKTFASPKGGRVMEVDESVMSYSLVSRDAAGRARMQCVTGEQAALAALAKPAQEDRHGH